MGGQEEVHADWILRKSCNPILWRGSQQSDARRHGIGGPYPEEPDPDHLLDETVLEYEELMFPGAEKLQAVTMTNKENMFGPGTPTTLIPPYAGR